MTPPGGGLLGPLRRLAAASLPDCLGDLPRPVAVLWCLGDPEALAEAPARHVAIVGTREASPYGVRTAELLAAACAEAGLVVVSGMARGVDAAAHRAALAAGGRTIGVQGTGVDVPYPASHRALHEAVCRRGTVLSEMEPGTLATPGCFPRRNRIIAALCSVTVVVEAGFRSGAINTASQALDLGRTVAAVPGRVEDERAQGSNRLIRDGAQVITDVEDLLSLFGISTSAPAPGRGQDSTSGVVGGLIEALHTGDLAARGDAPPGKIRLERGIIDATPFRHVAAQLLDGELAGTLDREGLDYAVRRRR